MDGMERESSQEKEQFCCRKQPAAAAEHRDSLPGCWAGPGQSLALGLACARQVCVSQQSEELQPRACSGNPLWLGRIPTLLGYCFVSELSKI